MDGILRPHAHVHVVPRRAKDLEKNDEAHSWLMFVDVGWWLVHGYIYIAMVNDGWLVLMVQHSG